jgi:hypothetical protein
MPNREPSAAPPSSTTIGWSVSGTGVNGSGTLTWAAAAVSALTKSTAATFSGSTKSAPARVPSSVLASPACRIRWFIRLEF